MFRLLRPVPARDAAGNARYVEALGGKLSLVAEFPDRNPVILSGIAEDEPAPKSNGRKRMAAGAKPVSP